MIQDDLFNKLTSLNIFENNDYFKQYIEYVSERKNNPRIKFKTQQHHIIPKCYFKFNNLKIDNTNENLVNLTYAEHIYVHYLLCLCVSNDFKFKLENAFLHLVQCDTIPEFERNKIKKLKHFQKLYDDWMEKNPWIKKGAMPSTKGRIAIHKDGKCKFVLPDKLNEYLSLGWVKGGLPKSEEEKRKLSEKRLSLHLKHSDEFKAKLSKTRKEKFAKGELVAYNKGIRGVYHMPTEQKEKLSKYVTTLKTINKDGIEKRVPPEKLDSYLKEGWVLGSPKAVMLNKKYKGKKVICVTDNLIFNSMCECANYYNIDRYYIRKSIDNNVEVKGKRYKYI